jgi:hypothetical protein
VPHDDFRDRHTSSVSNIDLANMIRDLDDKVGDIASSLKSTNKAFPTNDLNEPDFDGHRKSHLAIIRAEKLMQNYKVEASKKIIGAAAIFLAGIIASGALMALKDAMKLTN